MSHANLEGVPPWIWKILSRGAILVVVAWVVLRVFSWQGTKDWVATQLEAPRPVAQAPIVLPCGDGDAGVLPVRETVTYIVPPKCGGTRWIEIPDGPSFTTAPRDRLFILKNYGSLDANGRPIIEERIESSPYTNTFPKRRPTGQSFANPSDKPVYVTIGPR